jgi:hypothetical protein
MPDNKKFIRVLAKDSNGMVRFFALGSSRIRFLAPVLKIYVNN